VLEATPVGSAPRIALDAMGGDVGPAVMVAGAARAHQRRGDLHFLLFGDEAAICAELDQPPSLAGVAKVVPCDDVIAPDEQPTQALRPPQTTSLGPPAHP